MRPVCASSTPAPPHPSTNSYLSPLTLTHTLLPLLEKTARENGQDARIVNVRLPAPASVPYSLPSPQGELRLTRPRAPRQTLQKQGRLQRRVQAADAPRDGPLRCAPFPLFPFAAHGHPRDQASPSSPCSCGPRRTWTLCTRHAMQRCALPLCVCVCVCVCRTAAAAAAAAAAVAAVAAVAVASTTT